MLINDWLILTQGKHPGMPVQTNLQTHTWTTEATRGHETVVPTPEIPSFSHCRTLKYTGGHNADVT